MSNEQRPRPRAPPERGDEPPPPRPRLHKEQCCDCSRFSTCASATGRKNSQGCACRAVGRVCTSCSCLRNCSNKFVTRRGQPSIFNFMAPSGTARPTPSPAAAAALPVVALPRTTEEDAASNPPEPVVEICLDATNQGGTAESTSTTTTTAAAAARAETIAEVLADEASPPVEELPTPTLTANANEVAAPAAEVPVQQEAPNAEGPAEAPAPSLVTELGADLPDYVESEADRRLNSVYGDHPHTNDGRHLNGGVDDDPGWQGHWKRVVQLPLTSYSVPKGRVGRRFVATLAQEFAGVRQRKWNSERPLVFAAVILQTTRGTTRAMDIRKRLTQRMDLWDKGRFGALVDDTEDELWSRVGGSRSNDTDDATARRFNSTVLSGRLRKAVRGLTNRDGGGVLQPDDACTKTGRPVLEILREKHPAIREPPLDGPGPGAFEAYDSTPDVVPLTATGTDVEQVASKLSGSAGPSGVDAVDLRNWLLRFGAESEALRDELAALTNLLANESPPWAAYRALMACRLVALDKQPGVRPVGIGEVYRRLMAKVLIGAFGHRATTACGNLNLCAGLPAGIEGAVHAMAAEWENEATMAIPAEGEPTVAPIPPIGQPAEFEPVPPGDAGADVPVTLLVDARNGFNELGRKAMLWTVRHRWAPGARFAFNCYRHSAMLILRRKGRPCRVILSEEGVTQGDPVSMIVYGLSMAPLAEGLRKEVPTVVQPWYADDSAMAGPSKEVARAMQLLEQWGPARGYFPEPDKSIVICRDEHEPTARQHLDRFRFKYSRGERYLGGFIGTQAAKEAWLEPQIQDWVYGVQQLSKAARRYPQTAYAGLAKSLQAEWQYLQRVLPNTGPAFEPLESALSEDFLPALLQEQGAIPDWLRKRFALPVKQAGIGIPDPSTTGEGYYLASKTCTEALTQSLRDGRDLDLDVHRKGTKTGRTEASKSRAAAAEATLTSLLAGQPAVNVRQARRAMKTGAWLSAMPDSLNGTDLSREEFCDSLRLRYGLAPTAMPNTCDGCTNRFSVEHAMSCKVGGLVSLRHNEMAAEWHQLCAQALTPSAVSDEPLIHSGLDLQQRANGEGREAMPENRGDVAAHGFWKRGATTIFDVRITDTDAPSNRQRDPAKVLKQHEKEKRDKYLADCLARRRHFTPLVFSVDGLRGVECDAAAKRLASMLSSKWKRSYPEVCGYVRSRLSIALVRSTSLCIRGARDPTARASRPAWDNGAGLGLYQGL